MKLRRFFLWFVCVSIVSTIAGGCGDDGPSKTYNHSPVIASLTATPDSVRTSGVSLLVCAATDPDGDSLSYEWTADAGVFSGGADSVAWTAPAAPGVYEIQVLVTDGRSGLDLDSIDVEVGVGVPEIQSLVATPSAVAPGEEVALVCVATDDDPEALAYFWHADGGTFAGSGDSVTWTAPPEEGVWEIRVRVDNGAGGSARDTVEVDVFGGTLLVQTRDGLIAVGLEGGSFVFAPDTAPVEVLGTRIFVKGGSSITELDHAGAAIGTVEILGPPVSGHNFVILPGAGFVFLDNVEDEMHFIDADGTFYDTVLMPEPSAENYQDVDGVVVGNRLIVSETGTTKLIAVELSDLSASIFRALDPNDGWLGAIDYWDGTYYLCRSQLIQRFTEAGGVEEVGPVPAGNITGIVRVGRYLYVVVNFEGTLRRVHAETGEVELLVDQLAYPQDIEYVPVDLTP